MFFKRSKKQPLPVDRTTNKGFENRVPDDLIPIEFDMMLKGSLYERKGGVVRQATVTVDGATRLVTSGDRIDRRTYDALVVAGAISPVPGLVPKPPPAVIEDQPEEELPRKAG